MPKLRLEIESKAGTALKISRCSDTTVLSVIEMPIKAPSSCLEEQNEAVKTLGSANFPHSFCMKIIFKLSSTVPATASF